MANALPLQCAVPMKVVGAAVPVAWPRDGTNRQADGAPLAQHYKRNGLVMLSEHATWPDGSVSTEAGVLEMDEREKSGRLKYARQLSDILDERRFYHRKDGQIVKLKDDLLSALRIAIMMKRFARMVMLGSQPMPAMRDVVASGTEFDVFTGGALSG